MRSGAVILILLILTSCCTDRNLHYVRALHLQRRGHERDGSFDGFNHFGGLAVQSTCWIYEDAVFPNKTLANRMIVGKGWCIPHSEITACEALNLTHTHSNIRCEVCDVRAQSCCYAPFGTRSLAAFLLTRAEEEPPENCCQPSPGPPTLPTFPTLTPPTDKPATSTPVTVTSSVSPKTTTTPPVTASSTTPSLPTSTGTPATKPTTPPPVPPSTPSAPPPTVTFAPTTSEGYTTAVPPPAPTPSGNDTRPCNDTLPNPRLPLPPNCGMALDPQYNTNGLCFLVDLGLYRPASCNSDKRASWASDGHHVGVIFNATMVLTVSGNGIMRDENTRNAVMDVAVRYPFKPRDSDKDINAQDHYIPVKRFFFQDDDFRMSDRAAERRLVLLQLEEPIDMRRACPVCFSDPRKDTALSDGSRYMDNEYTGLCELYGHSKSVWAYDWVIGDEAYVDFAKIPTHIPQLPWDIRSCVSKYTEGIKQQYQPPRYLRGPSLTGFCAGAPLRATACMFGIGTPLMCRDNTTAGFRLTGLQVDTECRENKAYGAIIEDVIDTATLRWLQMVTEYGNATSTPKTPCT